MEGWVQWGVLKNMMLVMCGGGLGAASRYGIGIVTARNWGTAFPWGTLVVNFTGCFLIGVLFALVERTRWVTPEARLFLITGYMGALTTFSSFSLETVFAARSGMLLTPLANVLVNTVGGLTLTVLGMWMVGLIFR